jgi:hypothetical protein
VRSHLRFVSVVNATLRFIRHVYVIIRALKPTFTAFSNCLPIKVYIQVLNFEFHYVYPVVLVQLPWRTEAAKGVTNCNLEQMLKILPLLNVKSSYDWQTPLLLEITYSLVYTEPDTR